MEAQCGGGEIGGGRFVSVDNDIDLVKEWLEYGQFHGMLQWRNSGKGRFVWEEIG